MEVISVVLLPGAEDSEKLVKFSEQFNSATKSLIQLGEGFLPHITVAQFTAPFSATQALWQEVVALRDQVSTLQSAGLSYVPTRDKNMTWVELQFLKTAALSDMQARILDSEFAKKSEVHSHVGDSFRPHATIGLLESKEIPAFDVSGFDIFGRQFTDLTVAVGINGEHFTFTKADFS